jgi:tRNA U34 5-carboxymethylaminomethyl modifying GTPase MnmE/TrmE
MVWPLAVLIFIGIAMTLAEYYYLSRQIEEFKVMVAESIAHLREQIEHAKTVKERAVTLLEHMRERLEDLANHPSAAEIRALADELRTNTDTLAAAIGEEEEED